MLTCARGGIGWILGKCSSLRETGTGNGHGTRAQGVFGQCSQVQGGILGLSCAGPEVGSMIPVIPFQLRVFYDSVSKFRFSWSCWHRRRPSKSRPPLGCGHSLGQEKPLLPLEKPGVAAGISKDFSRRISSLHRLFTCLDKDVFRMCGFPRSAPAFNHDPSAEIYFYPIKQLKHPTMLCRSILKS